MNGGYSSGVSYLVQLAHIAMVFSVVLVPDRSNGWAHTRQKGNAEPRQDDTCRQIPVRPSKVANRLWR